MLAFPDATAPWFVPEALPTAIAPVPDACAPLPPGRAGKPQHPSGPSPPAPTAMAPLAEACAPLPPVPPVPPASPEPAVPPPPIAVAPPAEALAPAPPVPEVPPAVPLAPSPPAPIAVAPPPEAAAPGPPGGCWSSPAATVGIAGSANDNVARGGVAGSEQGKQRQIPQSLNGAAPWRFGSASNGCAASHRNGSWQIPLDVSMPWMTAPDAVGLQRYPIPWLDGGR